MKSLIVLVLGLLAVGCATMKDICVQLGISKPNTPEQNQKLLRNSVVGEYEYKHEIFRTTHKLVFLENGVLRDLGPTSPAFGLVVPSFQLAANKKGEHKWSIVDGEIHVYDSVFIHVFRINEDRSITYIAMIRDGKRKDLTKEQQLTLKRIK